MRIAKMLHDIGAASWDEHYNPFYSATKLCLEDLNSNISITRN